MVYRNRATRIYRGAVLALAAAYWLFQFSAIPDAGMGGQFRWLTIWALSASLWSAAAAMAFDLGRGQPPFTVAAVAAVLNAIVVVMFWRLFFLDPGMVEAGDQPVPALLQYYLHLVGPLLQWGEAIVLLGAFRHPGRVTAAVVALIAGYVAWIEVLTAPFNDFPSGSVTSGLPYPFLNDMEPGQRLVFYGTTAVTMLVLTGVFWGVSAVRNRIAARADHPSPSRRRRSARPER